VLTPAVLCSYCPHLYQHAVLPTLLPAGIKLLLKHCLFTGDSLQLQSIGVCELIPRFTQLTLFAVQRLKQSIPASTPLYSNYLIKCSTLN
jgi:hypothetical protein